jgi:hypothetical protein
MEFRNGEAAVTASPQSLAVAFASELRSELSGEAFAEMARRNATPEYGSGICASHDFCDANMVMLAAFEHATGRAFDFESEADQRLWNAAWEQAHSDNLVKAPTRAEADPSAPTLRD